MPLYEYRCGSCRHRFTLLLGMTSEQPDQQCPRCGAAEVRRLISRFRMGRSEEQILESVTDPGTLGDPEDPRAMAGWMRRVSREMGEELDDDFEQLVEEAVREEEGGSPADGESPSPDSDFD